MTTEPVRASSGWLALREPADAVARSPELARLVADHLDRSTTTRIHDLGSGTGSMARWLAPRLPGPQHWVLYDRDTELLAETASRVAPTAADGAAVTLETRDRDITRLEPDELAGADLVTASALLDMLTEAELGRLVDSCARAGCPALITLSVVGRAELTPFDPFDLEVMEAFNAHQRRANDTGRILGPDASAAAAEGFSRRGLDVAVRPSPWRLGRDETALTLEWLAGWVDAACEQRPDLTEAAQTYARRRRSEALAGALSVTVHHEDLLVVPG